MNLSEGSVITLFTNNGKIFGRYPNDEDVEKDLINTSLWQKIIDDTNNQLIKDFPELNLR